MIASLLALAAGACAAGAVGEAASAPRRGRRRAGAALPRPAGVGRGLGSPRPGAGLAARVDAAGAPLGLAVADIVAVKGGACVLAALLVAPLALRMAPAPGVIALAIIAAAGWLAPDWWLRRRARSRAQVMQAELADVLDLLRVAVEAGLPASRACAQVARHHPGLLARELGRAAAEHALGVPRESALAGLARRAPLPGVRALVAAFRRADRHGAPLGPALCALAAQARTDRAREAREAAAR